MNNWIHSSDSVFKHNSSDFKGMKFVNRMLQDAGAFYIRRSFGQDRLYWSAVSEYIQYQIMNFQAPIEFFLEGTRSRNGKSLPPKTGNLLHLVLVVNSNKLMPLYLGLLTMALEPYLKGDVPDIKICTISISYERTLEENLYAYELLGIPKPRESTSVREIIIIFHIMIVINCNYIFYLRDF